MRGDVGFRLHGALESKDSVILQVHSQLLDLDWNIIINIIDLVIYQFFRKNSSVLRRQKSSHLFAS